MTPGPAPCACGHAHRFGASCTECSCSRYCPDYVAQARSAGLDVTPEMRRYQRNVEWSMEWTPPSSLDPRPCAYCDRPFRPQRRHRTTCSGACRVALHRALRYGDGDVPPASSDVRRDTVSAERRAATGVGIMTASESYEADVRVRARERG